MSKYRNSIKLAYCFIAGKVTGLLAGMFGVGGGEFRLPVLLHFIRSLRSVIAVNLIVGLFTVVFSSALRLIMGFITYKTIKYSIYICIGSVAGTYIGTLCESKLSEKYLRISITIYLIIVGIRLILIPWLGDINLDLRLSDFIILEILTLIIIGVLAGFPAAIFGIAGGEIRIPLLLILLNLTVKEAGTLSLIASIFTILTAFIEHSKKYNIELSHYDISAMMAIGSCIGITLGVYFVLISPDKILKALLGIVLIIASLRFIRKN